ncbi:hypothetical protein Sjap_019301 [Stephania japonica]|uniref:BED-type domain-containing protein n=1 Tax=Stephania japonica TaxID=461633 RepID=A0AAP0F403_9MAGN
MASTAENNEPGTAEVQPSKRRRKKSIVWEHFTVEPVGAGCTRACCKRCKQTFAYSTGSKVAGTSHLKRHIALGTCPVIRRREEKNQLTPYFPNTKAVTPGSTTDPPKRRYRSSMYSSNISFDQDRCRQEIAEMIIMHEYPLNMVEHPAFVSFVQNLQPRFQMVNFNTVQGDCVAIYLREKQDLVKLLMGLPGRINLTLDLWISNQTLGYIFLTGHFIDNDWKLTKRLLNVVMVPSPHSGDALSHAVGVCIGDWGLETRLFTLTTDKEISNDSEIESLRGYLSIKNPLTISGQLLIGHCYARVLTSVAKDLLSSMSEVVCKVRESVKYVLTSQAHEEKFAELKHRLQVPSAKHLSLDDQSFWNTTYLMLVAATELKEVFSCFDTIDPDYKMAPSVDDWKQVETLCVFLKLLYDAANVLTGTTYPTANLYFQEVWKIQLELTLSAASEDPFISNLTMPLKEKFERYWKDCSLVLATAVVMDPRFKLKLVEFSFSKIYGEEAVNYVKIVDDGIHELFSEYLVLPLMLTAGYVEVSEGENKIDGAQTSPKGTPLLTSGDRLLDFDVFISEMSTSQNSKSELDQYLDESLLPRTQEFDILGWWKLNSMKYPTLSRMARDILAITVSTVGPESVFNTSPRNLDPYRSSLRPETVEALICAKDWLHYASKEQQQQQQQQQPSNAIVKVEF